MNKKYMDFVPVKATEKTAKKPARKVYPKKASSDVSVEEVMAVKETKPQAGVSVGKRGPEYVSASDVQTKFLKTEVNKRPLSKNVYTKESTVLSKETKELKEVKAPSGPVTIINKPEKDSKVGLVVTILITIILGAAAGTVAFLLLPK